MIGFHLIAIVFTAAEFFVNFWLSLIFFIIDVYILLLLISLHNKFKKAEKKMAAQDPLRTVTSSQSLDTNEGISEPNSHDPAILTNTSDAVNLPFNTPQNYKANFKF